MAVPMPPGPPPSPPGSLAWPSHDAPPTPPRGPEATKREGETRRPLAFWDRFKFLWLFTLIFAFVLWRHTADNPLLSFNDALLETWESLRILEVLFVAEVIRQIHYLISERSRGWHHFVTESVFGRWNRFVDRREPWTRFRVARAVKAVIFLAVFGAILGVLWDMPWYEALFDAPARIGRALFSTGGQLPMIFQFAMIMFIAVGQFVAIFWFLSRGGTDVYRPQDIKTRFTDVWGQDPVLERVQENMVFLDDPRSIEDKGGYVPGGVLLWGPPGTGKTLLAEAVAGETGKPFVFVEPGAFNAMFFGVGIMKVKALYRKLRKLALRYGGVIVFMDEADSLGSRGGSVSGARPAMLPHPLFDDRCGHWMSPATQRLLMDEHTSVPEPEPKISRFIMGGMNGGGGGMGTLQALLTEMSGLKKPRGFWNKYVRRFLNMTPRPPFNYRILTIMATNQPDVLDPALLRPGRIDRKYKMGYPSADGRQRTFEGYLAKVSHELTTDQVRRLAVISTRATGASIKDIVNEALVIAIRDDRDTINYQDMIKAKQLKEHGPADDWTYSDWEQHALAVHEASHAITGYRLRKREAIDIATIERRGDVGGFVSRVELEETFVDWSAGLENDVISGLASLAGERLFFDDQNSTGVGGDLSTATRIVMRMYGFAGMGTNVASMGATLGLVGRAPSVIVEDGTDRQFLETDFGKRVDAKLHELLDRARHMLETDRDHVLAIAHALETYKTISGEDIEAIVEGHRGPLVDGSRYHDPVMRAELETYHASVVAAMKAQSRVAQPLPVLPGTLVATATEEPVPVPASAWAPPAPGPNGGTANPYGYPLAPPDGGNEYPAYPPSPPPPTGGNGHPPPPLPPPNGGQPNGGSPPPTQQPPPAGDPPQPPG